jgi:hypothetical protein
MFTLDFYWSLAFFMVVLLLPVLFLSLGGKKQKSKELFLNPEFIWFCSVCTYTYINTKQDSISLCPRCASYNKKKS